MRPCIIENHVPKIGSDEKKIYYPTLYHYWLQKSHNSQHTCEISHCTSNIHLFISYVMASLCLHYTINSRTDYVM